MPRSSLSTLSVAVSRRKWLPAKGGNPSQRATSTCKRWPWANTSTGPSPPSQPRDHPIHPGSHLIRAFALGTAIAKHQPIRRTSNDLRAGEALIGPIVPRHQISIKFHPVRETGQFTGVPGPLQRAGEQASEGKGSQNGSQSSLAAASPAGVRGGMAHIAHADWGLSASKR